MFGLTAEVRSVEPFLLHTKTLAAGCSTTAHDKPPIADDIVRHFKAGGTIWIAGMDFTEIKFA